MSGILAFDLATNTGWAHATKEAITEHWPEDLPGKNGPLDGVEYGSFNTGLPGTVTPQKWLAMHLQLEHFVASFRPDLIVFEAPLPQVKGIPGSTVRLLIVFAGIVEMIAFSRGIRCMEENPMTVKKWATGSGKALKEDMVAAAVARGWDADNHDEADALMLLDFTVFQKVL